MFLLQPIRFGGPVNVECGFVMFELPKNVELKPHDDPSHDISAEIAPNVLYLYHLDALWKIYPSEQQERTDTSTDTNYTEQKETLIASAKGNIPLC